MFLEQTNRTKIRIVLCLDSGAGKEWGWDGIHMEEEGYGGREVSRWKRKRIKTKSFSPELTWHMAKTKEKGITNCPLCCPFNCGRSCGAETSRRRKETNKFVRVDELRFIDSCAGGCLPCENDARSQAAACRRAISDRVAIYPRNG